MKNKWLWLILGLAILVRVYALTKTPYGFHVDEVKAGYQAYSILTTGRDDKGNWWPMYYNSFGDYRPAGLIYLMIPFVAILGRTILAVRLPFALVGGLTVIPIFLIVSELADKKDKKVAILAAGLLAFNPWHIILGRATSEAVVMIFLAAWGIYFLIKTIKNDSWKMAVWSILFWSLSYFFYHSIRVLAPLFVLTIGLWWRKSLKKVGLVLGTLIILTIVMMMSKEAQGRMSQVGIKSDFRILYEVTKMPTEEGPGKVLIARAFHNRIASLGRVFLEEYRNYFSTNFLLGNLGKPIRYTVPQMGIVTYFEVLLIVLSLMLVKEKKGLGLIVILLALAPLPAAVTNEDTPNIVRSSLMILPLVIMGGYGANLIGELKGKWRVLGGLMGIGYLLNFVYFGHMYLSHEGQSLASYYRNGGNVELVESVDKIANNYDKIILTNSPDSLYPWFAFFNKLNNKLVFSEDKCPVNKLLVAGEILPPKTLIVDAEGCEVNQKFVKEEKIKLVEVIKRPDGSPPYYLWQYLGK